MQLSLNGDFIKEFKDSVQASKELNLYDTNIRSCCRAAEGYRKYPYSVGGFKFIHKSTFELQRIKEQSDKQ